MAEVIEAALLDEVEIGSIFEYQGGPLSPPPITIHDKIIKATVKNPEIPSQLLFISDIEGCLEKHGQIDQNVSLCDVKNYLPSGPLFKFLLKNSKNKIAFLGDYFDKGPGVASSIQGITFLHKCFPDRVHIILGNRDVNKFRLGYEVIEQQRMSGPEVDLSPDDTKWNMWLKKLVDRKDAQGNIIKDAQGNNIKDDVPVFYHPYHSANTHFDRFKIILEESMGAAPINIGAIISYELNKLLDKDKAARIGAYYLTKVFDDSVEPSDFEIDGDIQISDLDTFVNDCRYLFTNGDIVKGDADYNVLMSHAGGFNKCILQSESFYNGIMRLQKKRKYEETIVESNKKPRIPGGDPSNPNYFDEMERMRRALDCEDIMDIDEDIITIDEAVIYHNKLYTDFVNAYFKYPTIRNTTLLPQHLLLQAMGLKPDSNKPQSKFASFIQSCGSGKSNGPGCDILGDNESNEFISKLGYYKAVAHGHVPTCMRHHLLINRNGIVFISNDTSNGNRPKLDNSLSSLPLSYIQKGTDGIKYGICFIDTNGTIRIPTFDEMNFKNDGTTKYSNQDASVYNTLALIGGPYFLKDIPNADTVKQYIQWNVFAPGNIIDPPKGGSSTRKKQKRGDKKNTRRIVKNNRKTKRRSKHHCSHCK
jgi:hypothetical protein